MMRKNNKYSNELKLEVVELKKKGFSYTELKEKYQIKSNTQIKVWVRKYDEGGEALLFTDNRGKASRGRPKKNFDSPLEKIKYLEQENEWLKKSIEKKWGVKL